MPMSAEARAAQSERMKLRHAANRQGNSGIAPEPNEEELKLKAELARIEAPTAKKPDTVFGITVKVDWAHIPMQEARLAYAELKSQYEQAGVILNARSMGEAPEFTCFICKKTHPGRPAGEDNAHKDPDTGLLAPVKICGTICWEKYQVLLFEQRRDRNQRMEAAR